jgi:predicted Zn-dependent protease
LQIARALAELEIAAGRLDAAESVYRRMQRVHPADARLLNNLALVRYERGDLTEALDLLRQATALRPDYVNARINYAQLLERAGYPAQAVAQLEEALRRAGDDKLQQLAAERLDALRLRAGQGGAP